MKESGASLLAGRVVAVSTAEVDVAFDAEPPPLGAVLSIRRADPTGSPCRVVVTAPVAGATRCVPVDDTVGLARGAVATLLSAPDARALFTTRDEPSWSVGSRSRLDTGIPVIDELAPIARGGSTAIVGLDLAPWWSLTSDVLARVGSDPALRLVLVGAESLLAPWPDGALRAPVERCTFPDHGLPGAILLALARALDAARATAPPRHAMVVVAGFDLVVARVSTIRTRGSRSVIELWLDALDAAEPSRVLAWSTPVDELDDDDVLARVASGLDTTLVLDRHLASMGAPWPLDPLRSTSRHAPADEDHALSLRALLARARAIREERLAVLGAEQLDPADRAELARATNELHRLVGLPVLADEALDPGGGGPSIQ
ncbi:MAG: hypothetical protein IT379_33985 [Deltaproteobacteria bacterium]|nr:hypothetical protein [Deltaproteobacteria bacterium]